MIFFLNLVEFIFKVYWWIYFKYFLIAFRLFDFLDLDFFNIISKVPKVTINNLRGLLVNTKNGLK